jgi:hypothetical protein
LRGGIHSGSGLSRTRDFLVQSALYPQDQQGSFWSDGDTMNDKILFLVRIVRVCVDGTNIGTRCCI